MRDPKSDRFKKWTQLMMSGQFVGPDRPISRVSMAKPKQVGLNSSRGIWRTVLHTEPTHPGNKIHASELEIGQIISIDITRTLGQDSATCSIKLYNVWNTSEDPEGLDTLLRPGFLTFDRGDEHQKTRSLYDSAVDPALHNALPGQTFPTDWGYAKNLWHDFLMPNTVVRTWFGYGTDSVGYVHDPGANQYIPPWDDTQLVCNGTWLIDKVQFNSDYTITLECRDMAKLLLEQYVYPPMLPMTRFPLIYCPDYGPSGGNSGNANLKPYGKSAVRWVTPLTSNDVYIGQNAYMLGHKPSDAFDSKPATYWLSVGNSVPNADYSFEYIQCATGGDTINQIEVDVYGSNYRIYVSILENGHWVGSQTVPYNPSSSAAFQPNGNGANIPYVQETLSGLGETCRIRLNRSYKAQAVRVTFTNLWDSGIGPYRYRAAVREFRVFFNPNPAALQSPGSSDAAVPGTVGKPGYIHDWMDVVKELACWAGFTWVGAPSSDPVIGTATSNNKASFRSQHLRVWGDLEITVGPIVCTNADYFVNKSFMEAIKQVADFLGNIVMVDESGGLICRQPNIWAIGNFIDDPDAPPGTKAYLEGNYIEFHENANLITYSATIDDTDIRSEIEVIGMYPGTSASAVPIAGGTTLDGESSAIDFTDVLAGQQRLFIVPGDASALLSKPLECQRMAELTALAIMMNYRKGQIHAPYHPGLQVDDQVRIYERTTNENNLHYVSGIRVSHNLISGEAFMDVDTHWLGKSPKGAGDWFTNKIKLTPAVLQLPAILKRIGKYGTDNRGEQQPPYNFAGSGAKGIPAGYGYGNDPLAGIPPIDQS